MQEPKGIALPGGMRLRAVAETANGLFISGLPVNGLLLAEEAGYRPIARVTGCSVYNIGWQFPNKSGEVIALTNAYRQARTLALSRMQDQARMANAHGVVDVRVRRQKRDRGGKQLAYSASGTAVRIPGETPPEKPFLSDLSGQEIWALKKAGFHPVGLVYGNCVWYEAASFATLQAAGAANQYSLGVNPSSLNQELADYTEAVSKGWRLAMARLHEECDRVGASGLLGAEIEKKLTELHMYSLGLIVSFQISGTAIAQAGEGGKAPALDNRLMLSDPPASDQIFLDL